MGASLALAGIDGVHAAAHRAHHVPYVRQPEELVPGRPLFFATAMPLGGPPDCWWKATKGVPPRWKAIRSIPAPWARAMFTRRHPCWVVRSRSLAGAVARRRDPDGAISWRVPASGLDGAEGQARRGLRILTETVTSPTLADADQGDPEALSGGQMASMGAGRTAFGAAPERGWPSGSRQHVLRSDQGRHDRFARRGFSGVRRRQPAVRAAVRGAAARARRSRRRMNRLYVVGAHADTHGRQGRPSPAAARGDVEQFAWALAPRWARIPADGRALTAASTSGPGPSRAICSASRRRAW
jgi:hypothetical protein